MADDPAGENLVHQNLIGSWWFGLEPVKSAPSAHVSTFPGGCVDHQLMTHAGGDSHPISVKVLRGTWSNSANVPTSWAPCCHDSKLEGSKEEREREREREREKEWKRERRKKGNGVTINIAFIPSAALTGWHNESVSTTPGAVGFHLLMATLCPETLLKYSILRLFFWFILLLLWLFLLLFSMLMISDVESWKTFPCHLPINHDHYHH